MAKKYNYVVMPFLTQAECDTIIDYYDSNIDRVVNDTVTLNGKILPRDQDVISLTDQDEIYRFFQQRLREKHPEICKGLGWDQNYLRERYQQYCKESCGISTPPEFVDNIKTYEVLLSKYSIGKYVAMHTDNNTIGRMFTDWYWSASKLNPTKRHQHPRLYTVSLLLNDDYEGGELSLITDESTNEKVTIKPKPGEIVVLDPNCWHEVKAVSRGKRYVVISWAYTDNDVFIPAGSPKNIFDLARSS